MSTSSKPAMHPPTSLSREDGSTPPKTVSAFSANSGAAIALNMVWQLLAIVIVPLVGGYMLDNHFDSTPLYMCIGMGVALVLTVLVVRQAMAQLNEIMQRDAKEHHD